LLDGGGSQGGSKVFGGERGCWKAQDAGDSRFNRGRRVEEEDLRLGTVDVGSRGQREIVEQGFEAGGFLDRGIPKEHRIVNKLLMRGGRRIMHRNTFEFPRKESMLYMTTKTFSHKNEEEGG